MSRCQHNQKITKFCITASCTHPSSGGCEYCFKRYHCHIGEAKVLKETEVLQILKDLTAFEDKKIKVRPLKQAIYNYFNIIKGQLSSYIDAMSADLLNRITFPFIRKQGKLGVVKKLKHKEYNKLTTEEMVKLSEFRASNPPQKLQASEIYSYFEETKEVHQKVIAINNLYKMFENETQDSYLGQAIMSVGIYYKKILDILDHIDTEKANLQSRAQQNYAKKETLKNYLQRPISDKKQDQLPPNQQSGIKEVQFKLQVKTKSHDESKRPSIQTQQIAQTIEKQKIQSSKKQTRSRKASIDSRCSDLIGHSRLKTYEEKQKQIMERKLKLDEMMNKKDKNQRVSESSSSSTEKQKHKEIETTDKLNGSNLAESNVKSTKSRDQNPAEMVAHTLLPQGKDDKKLYEQFQAIEKKTLKIPVNVIQQNTQGQQCQSPIFKLKKSQKKKPAQGSFQFGLFKLQQTQHETTDQTEEARSSPIQKAYQVQSQSSSQNSDKENVKPLVTDQEQMNVSQQEANSIFLLAESLKLSAKKAIPLLQAALKYAPHNFSAAEYLSYLFLEQNKPKECLKVCNEALKMISGQPNSIQISFHLFNNKAAALNLLGRFSESIPILQKCIEVKKKDILYKNLGDAYFNLGILEKAVINYENATIMNDDNHEALYNLAVCLFMQKNFESSKLKVQRAMMMDHNNDSYLELYKQIGSAIQQEKAR